MAVAKSSTTAKDLFAAFADQILPFDVFIVSRAAMHGAVFERLQADGPRCP